MGKQERRIFEYIIDAGAVGVCASDIVADLELPGRLSAYPQLKVLERRGLIESFTQKLVIQYKNRTAAQSVKLWRAVRRGKGTL